MTAEYGDRHTASVNTILRTQVGSGVHGIAIPGTDDRDEMGVFIEPAELVIGLAPPMDHYIWRTQDEGQRSGPGDLDLTLYSLRKYLKLAIKGNPTALLPLFAPFDDLVVSTGYGIELRNMRHAFLSRQAVERFLGYMHGQRERMMGRGRRSAVPNRPELIERYGWDTKYGAHAYRLAVEGHQIAFEGTLTLPLRSGDRETVLAIKQGHLTRERVESMIRATEAEIQDALDRDRLAVPNRPDVAAISSWSQAAHLEWWAARRDLANR